MAIKTYKASTKKINGVKLEIEARGHKVTVDEPTKSGGSDEGMTPVEMMLGSLGACQAMTTVLFGQMYGIKIDEIRVDVEGDKDANSMMGNKPDVRSGFTNIRAHFYVKSNVPEARIRQLLSLVEQKCPVGESIQNGVTIENAALTMIC